jgi:hypothetical protein
LHDWALDCTPFLRRYAIKGCDRNSAGHTPWR